MPTWLAKVTSGVVILAGLATILTPFHLAPVCQKLLELKTGNMVHMRCHYTGQAEVFLGVIILVAGLLLALAQDSKTRKSLGKLLALLGLLVIIIPTNYGIGVCLQPMACHITARVLYLLGGILFASGLIVHLEKDDSLTRGQNLAS